MKKAVCICSCVIGILLIILGSMMKMKENAAVFIIGGADGPTSVFLAGKLNGSLAVLLIFIGIILLAVVLFVLKKRKR